MRFLFFATIMLVMSSAHAQQKFALELTNSKNPEKKVLFNEGDRVTLYNSDGIELTGSLHIQDEATIIVDSQSVAIKSIPIIINRKSTGFGAKAGGAAMVLAGAGITIIGFAIIFTGIAEGLPKVLFLAPAGLATNYLGLRITSIGFSIIVGKGKKYYLDLDWKIKVVAV